MGESDCGWLTNGKRSFPKTLLASAVSIAVGATGAMSLSAQNLDLEEVLVTATRRAESIQDIPYNISALTGAKLADERILGLSDLSRAVPGIAFVDQGPVARSGNNNIALRGLNIQSASNNGGVAAQTAASVSTYLGEAPVFFPFALRDIERVEVLRGPQGTLYGASSLGGTIRFMPYDADPQEFHAEMEGSLSDTRDAGDLNYTADGVLNIPIVENVFAARIAAGYTEEAGFIDAVGRPVTGSSDVPIPSIPGDLNSGLVIGSPLNDVNDSETWYARLSFTWDITENISAKFRYQHDDQKQAEQQIVNPSRSGITVNTSRGLVPGSNYVDSGSCGPGVNFPGNYYCGAGLPFENGDTQFPASGDNKNLTTATEPYEAEADLYALDLEFDFGFATLTSATSYYDIEEDMGSDFSGGFETTGSEGANSLVSYYVYYPRFTAHSRNQNNVTGATQEFRLVSQWDKRWNFIVGAFYQELDNQFSIVDRIPGLSEWDSENFFFGFNNETLPDIAYTLDRNLEFEDIAVFGEITFDISDKWQVTGGVRMFEQELETDLLQTSPFCGSPCAEDGEDVLGTVRVPAAKEKYSDEIFKLNTSYDIDDDTMIYFTWAEGFRRGGANSVPLGGNFASLPVYQTYDPDEVTNWEIGIKGSIGDSVAYTLAGFFIEWDSFQFDTFSGAFLPLVVNGSEAESQGIEFSLNGSLTDSIRYNLGYAYTDAQVTEDQVIVDLPLGGGEPVPQTVLRDGDSIPGIPENSLTLGLDYDHSISFFGTPTDVNWHIDGAFRDEVQSNFNEDSPNFYIMDDFWMWNASVSFATESWRTSIFVRNLGDEEGITGGSSESTFGTRGQQFFVVRPRTIGLSARYTF